ncbi:unnamed protein product [Ranitomeya imitator]|uniref:CCHC-type domain-containing protein n=1 Tax=Ranitomeya imitator TaxID=111125 RepID=A0ABN9LEW5_9NEOB|nr:unnamed protein product [Ranitomeya imitator]
MASLSCAPTLRAVTRVGCSRRLTPVTRFSAAAASPFPPIHSYISLSFVLLEALRRKGCTAVPLVRHDIWVILDTGVDMDIQGLCSSMDNLVINVQKIQDTIDQKSMLEPRIPIPDLFFGDRTKFLSFKNNCKLFLALKPHSSGNPIQQVLIIISFLRGDPQDWAFSLAPGDPALSSVDAFFLALGLLYDEPNSVDQAEKNLLALCQGQDDIEVYCQKFRKWSVLTQWNESALAALFRKGLSEALKDVMVGFPMPAGLNESLSLAIQIGRRLRERKSVHHLAVLPEVKPEPMQCDRTMTRVERQEYRRLNGLCFYCGDSTHAISDCPKRTKRSARSAVIGTVQSKFLLSITLICSLSSFSVMAFVDSGAALNLMDLDYAKRCGFFLKPLRCPIPLRGIDATPLAKNKPQYWAQLTMCMAPAHQEVIRFLVLHNLHDVVVLSFVLLEALRRKGCTAVPLVRHAHISLFFIFIHLRFNASEPGTNKKTPQRFPNCKPWSSSINSPSNDTDQQLDIFWDPHSPTTFKLENGRKKLATNKCTVDISDIVNRIAPKNEKPSCSESPYLGIWIGEDAIPCTPVVARSRTRMPRSKILQTEEKLMRLAKQLDSNLVKQKGQSEAHSANSEDEMVSECNAVNEDNSFLEDFPGEDDVPAGLKSVSQRSTTEEQSEVCGPGCRSCFY